MQGSQGWAGKLVLCQFSKACLTGTSDSRHQASRACKCQSGVFSSHTGEEMGAWVSKAISTLNTLWQPSVEKEAVPGVPGQWPLGSCLL